jgi:hypothetical protein
VVQPQQQLLLQPVSKATREAEFTKLLTVMVSNQQIGGWDLAFLKEFGAFPSHPSFISSFETKNYSRSTEQNPPITPPEAINRGSLELCLAPVAKCPVHIKRATHNRPGLRREARHKLRRPWLAPAAATRYRLPRPALRHAVLLETHSCRKRSVFE